MTAEKRSSTDVRLFAYPHFPENPWQQIVYSAFVAAGGEVAPLEDLLHLDDAPQDGRIEILHMNWTGPVTQNAPDLITSATSSRSAIAIIDRFRARGGHVVWSIHNALPHEVRFLLPELALSRALARRADRIVVMNPRTVEAVAGLYPLDQRKLVQIDHPSYVGVFPDATDRTAARRRLGFSGEAIVTAFVGVIRPYKGVEQLLDAYEIIAAQDDRQRLIIGGEPGPGYSADELQRILRPRAHATIVPARIPDDELQHWMAAADMVALPYLGGLNVSVILLAASFSTPVAMRRLPDLGFLDGEEWIAWIDGEGEQLAESLLSAQRALMARSRAGAAARQYAEDRSPERISALYRDLFESVADAR